MKDWLRSVAGEEFDNEQHVRRGENNTWFSDEAAAAFIGYAFTGEMAHHFLTMIEKTKLVLSPPSYTDAASVPVQSQQSSSSYKECTVTQDEIVHAAVLSTMVSSEDYKAQRTELDELTDNTAIRKKIDDYQSAKILEINDHRLAHAAVPNTVISPAVYKQLSDDYSELSDKHRHLCAEFDEMQRLKSTIKNPQNKPVETAEAVKDQVISDLQANTNRVLHDNKTIRKNNDESRSAKNLEIDDLVRIILAERGAHAAVKNRLKTCFIRNKTLANLVRGQKLELKRRRSNMRTQQRRLNTRKVTIRNLRTTQERLESLNRHLLLRNTELVEDFDQYTDDVDAQLLMTNELRHVNVTPATRGTHDMLVRNFIYTTATTIGSRVCSMYRTPGLMTFVDHAATTKFFVDVVMQGVDIIGAALLKPGFWLNPVNCRISVYRYMKRAYGTEYCTVVSLAQLMFEVKKFNNWVRSLTPVYHYLLLPQERMMQDAFP